MKMPKDKKVRINSDEEAYGCRYQNQLFLTPKSSSLDPYGNHKDTR